MKDLRIQNLQREQLPVKIEPVTNPVTKVKNDGLPSALSGDNNPEQPAEQVKLDYYLKTQGGIFATPGPSQMSLSIDEGKSSLIPFVNEAFGVKIKGESSGLFANAELGAGTAISANVKAGLEVPVGASSLDFELSGDVRIAKSLINKQETFDSVSYRNLLGKHCIVELQEPIDVNYKQSNGTAGLNLKFILNASDNLKFGAGVRVATNWSNTPYATPNIIPLKPDIPGAEPNNPSASANNNNPCGKGDPININNNVNVDLNYVVGTVDDKTANIKNVNNSTSIGFTGGVSYSPTKNLEIGVDVNGRDVLGSLTWHLE